MNSVPGLAAGCLAALHSTGWPGSPPGCRKGVQIGCLDGSLRENGRATGRICKFGCGMGQFFQTGAAE
ncbi:MAG: hypothetical protein Q8K46_02000 [Deltaproteobacteria bacterium]|nr:hypothetical protein [Deltaproteobacteria bacterium]